jgi:DNA-binding NarL/FixJ family response regulator
MSVTILVVDDHALIRKGIIAILKSHDSRWVLSEAENGVQAILKANEIKPDIILMDNIMPKLDGVKAASVIHKNHPNTKIIMVSMDMSPEFIISSINAGVMGILPKDSSDKEMITAIDSVKNGKHHLTGHVSEIATQHIIDKKKRRKRTPGSTKGSLTNKEMVILKLLFKGLSSSDIGSHLSISPRTVDNHKANIFKKCHVHSVSELIRFALKAKLVQI